MATLVSLAACLCFVRAKAATATDPNKSNNLPIPAMTSPTVTVLDNGAYSAKIGTSALKQPKWVAHTVTAGDTN